MAGAAAQELLDNALKRRDELWVELEALNRFIETYERLLNKNNPAENAATDQSELFQPPSRAERIASMINMARRIILDEKRPMRRGELRERVEATGCEVEGKDKNKVFGTNLWRSGKFKMIEGRGYWPIDVELPSESR